MREASLRIEILDQQVVDKDGLPFGRVDDVELDLSLAPEMEPRVTRLLCNQEVLGDRLGGFSGALMARSARRLRGRGRGGFGFRPVDVEDWGTVVKLRSRLADLDAAPLERWLSDRVVRHLPGAFDAGQ